MPVASTAPSRIVQGWKESLPPVRRRSRICGLVLALCAYEEFRLLTFAVPFHRESLPTLSRPPCHEASARRRPPPCLEAQADVDLDTETDAMVEEMNVLASTTKHHHSSAAAAARAAEPHGSEAKKPKGLQPVLTLPGDTLEETPFMVTQTVLATLSALAVICHACAATPLKAAVGILCGILGAELFSGCFHWATDNYGSLSTPIVGEACYAFQGHHLAPWTISFRSFGNNVYKIARLATPLVVICALAMPPGVAAFFAVVFYGQVLAQDFHRWSHTPAKQLAPWQRWLQRSGLAVSTAEHCAHHKPPFAAHYCILNGMLNPVLDSKPVLLWRRLEAFFYRWTKVEPNCWKGEKGRAVRDVALAL
mmetsp:Transcript_56440/g.104488  ORF Transcript_56440/g.104488 Transcript_56440/m.104488 type:complete len:365 (-) Transcript_56440:98-1192(-)